MRAERASLAVLVAALLAGCSSGPDFAAPGAWSPSAWFKTETAPSTPAPATKPVASAPVAEPIDPDWWTIFGDPELTSLEKRVASANLDLRVATLRLAQSRAQLRIAAAPEFPTLNGEASYQRELPSKKGIFSLLSGGGSSSTPAPGGAGGAPAGGMPIAPFNLWQYGFDASWEADLWGRIARSIEAADATLEASKQARRDTLVSVLAEVARDYIQLRGTQRQLAISDENLAVAADNLALTKERESHGLASDLDVQQAAAQLDRTKATIPTLEQQETQAIDQLSFLLGDPPRTLSSELSTPQPIPATPPRVPIGLPSELARRRPDIREAEAQLHAQTAEVGVAVASFYPTITLNGSIDMQALRFKDLTSWGALTYTVGPSVSLPIFEGGRLTGNLELTKAAQQAAAIAYQRTVLNAWQEVDNALVAYAAEQKRREEIVAAIAHDRRALDLARDRYRQGLSTYLDVLVAQRQLLSSEQQGAESSTTVSLNLVALYKALGGGWENTEPRDAPTAAFSPL
jgi:NodT family efflux transporter outer membrane factor (OMF) lipoprotein